MTPDLVAHPDGREWHDLDGAARSVAVERYRADLHAGRLPVTVADVVRELAGLDLACWCPLDRPCHADVLLEVANQRPPNG